MNRFLELERLTYIYYSAYFRVRNVVLVCRKVIVVCLDFHLVLIFTFSPSLGSISVYFSVFLEEKTFLLFRWLFVWHFDVVEGNRLLNFLLLLKNG